MIAILDDILLIHTVNMYKHRKRWTSVDTFLYTFSSMIIYNAWSFLAFINLKKYKSYISFEQLKLMCEKSSMILQWFPGHIQDKIDQTLHSMIHVPCTFYGM